MTGVGVESGLIDRCVRLTSKYQMSHLTRFRCEGPDPLPFSEGLFDIVTSKDVIIHISDT